MDTATPFTANYPQENQEKVSFKKVFLVIILLVAGLFIWVYVSSPLMTSVTGFGEISAPAGSATISFSLATSADTPQSAIASVNAKSLLMTEFLKTKGVAEGDIAEGEVTAVPAALVTQGETGYQATITMAAKTTHVADVSSLVSDLYVNGAYVVSQPILSVDNREELDDQAYNLAMSDAKSQAVKVGLSNLKFVRKIVAITQATSGGTSTATTKPASTDTTASQTSIDNGVFKIVKTVTVTYKMW